jgi:hypothetical protein
MLASLPQTLYLASMLIKALWNNALSAKAQLSKQSSFASLLNTNVPMGNKKGTIVVFVCVYFKGIYVLYLCGRRLRGGGVAGVCWFLVQSSTNEGVESGVLVLGWNKRLEHPLKPTNQGLPLA